MDSVPDYDSRHDQTTIQRSLDGTTVIVAIAAIGAVLAITTAMLLTKGLWYDEAWTLYMARHDKPLAQMYFERWLYDVHPPLFYFIAWAFQPLTGESVVLGRTLNLLAAAVAMVAAGLIASLQPRLNLPIIISGVLLLSNPLSLNFLIDYRSYFLLISAWFVACCGIVAAGLAPRDFRQRDWPVATLTSAGIVIALNLHYLAALFAGTMLGVFILSEWLSGKRKWAFIHFLAGAIGSLLLLGNAYVQQQQLASLSVLEWSTSFMGSLKGAGSVVALAFGANLVAVAASARASLKSPETRFAITCIVAAAAAVMVAIAANAVHGILLRRYLVPILPVAAIAIGCLAAQGYRPAIFHAILANAVAVAFAFAIFPGGRGNWHDLAREIGVIVARCPDTQVIAVPNWRMGGLSGFPLRDQHEVLRTAYRNVGERYGFSPVVKGSDPPKLRVSACPVVVWVEHYQMPVPTPEQIAERAGLDGEMQSFRRSGTGFIATFLPTGGG